MIVELGYWHYTECLESGFLFEAKEGKSESLAIDNTLSRTRWTRDLNQCLF